MRCVRRSDPVATSILQRHEAERLAIRMVGYELPTAVVELGTGLPRERIKQMYREIGRASCRERVLRLV